MKTSRAEATAAAGERLERLAAPLMDAKDRLAGEAHERLAAARDSAFDAIAGRPLLWSLVVFAAGMVLGAAVGYARGESKNSNW